MIAFVSDGNFFFLDGNEESLLEGREGRRIERRIKILSQDETMERLRRRKS